MRLTIRGGTLGRHSDKSGFMSASQVKDSQEKDVFFKQLPSQLPHIPKPVAQKKLLPQLSQALQFGGAPASALGAVFMLAHLC